MGMSGKTAIVVGGGTGIGEGIALEFAQRGANVLVGGRRIEPLKTVAAKATGTVSCDTVDVADRDSVKAFVESAAASLGRIDILVNCAGINVAKRTLAELDPGDWDRMMAINATGLFNLLHFTLPIMREQKDGLIISVSSIAGLRALELAGVGYCASKFANSVIGTYGGLEDGKNGVRFTNIYPGEVETPLLDQRPVPVPAERRALMLQPSDVAAAAAMVAELPPRAHVMDLTIKPTVQMFA